MNDTLLWISRHLDLYHFHTDRARELKRDIDAWSCLPRREQEETAAALLKRFEAAFSNNPYVEQRGLVPDGRCSGKPGFELPGEITGASAQAYFDGSPGGGGRHYVLSPSYAFPDTAGSAYYGGSEARSFLLTQQKNAELALDAFAQLSRERLKAAEEHFRFILSPTALRSGKPGASPSLYHALAVLAFLCSFLSFLIRSVQVLARVGFHSGIVLEQLPMSLSLTSAILVCFLASLSYLLINLDRILPSLLKGPCRTWFCYRFQKYRKQVDADRDASRVPAPSVWFREYSDAIDRAAAAFQDSPGAFAEADATKTLLPEPPKNTRVGNLLPPPEPWEKYRRDGELGLSWPWLAIVLAVFACYLIYQFHFLRII